MGRQKEVPQETAGRAARPGYPLPCPGPRGATGRELDSSFSVCGNKDTEDLEKKPCLNSIKLPLGESVTKATSSLQGTGSVGEGSVPHSTQALSKDRNHLHLFPSLPHIHPKLGCPGPGFQEAPPKPAFLPQTTRPRRRTLNEG